MKTIKKKQKIKRKEKLSFLAKKNMKNNILKRFEYISIVLIITMVLNTYWVAYASQKSDLKNEQSSIDQKIEETNSEIAGVKSQMSDALKQITNFNTQIVGYEGEIVDLQSQIDTLQAQITEKQTNIKEQEEKYVEQKELLEKRLVAMYETGNTSYLDMLLSADGLSDFISKYYIIEQLTEYDTELLKNIQETKTKIETEKNELETAKTEVESSKKQIESKRSALTVLVSEKNVLVGNLSEEEKALESDLEQFEKDKKDIQAQLEAIAAAEAAERKAAEEARKKAEAAAAANSGSSSSSSDTTSSAAVSSPSTSGFICPLAGKSKANITTGYHGYAGHTGVDFACSSGTPIMAAKGGKVVISTALRNSSGGYRSYGNYVVISHGDGTMTLYAHMNSRAVESGATVSQGQTIGYVGSTGNSTGPHLHFEVRVNGKCVNPTSYLP